MSIVEQVLVVVLATFVGWLSNRIYQRYFAAWPKLTVNIHQVTTAQSTAPDRPGSIRITWYPYLSMRNESPYKAGNLKVVFADPSAFKELELPSSLDGFEETVKTRLTLKAYFPESERRGNREGWHDSMPETDFTVSYQNEKGRVFYTTVNITKGSEVKCKHLKRKPPQQVKR